MKMRQSVFFFSFFWCLFSCVPNLQQDPFFNNNLFYPPPPPLPIVRSEPKQPDPVKQGKCRQRGQRDCEGNKKCEDICDDIFNRRLDRKDCYKFSEDLVYEFEKLIEATEDGDIESIEDIGPETLECMLDISELAFAKAVRDMNRREAREFLLFIVREDIFSEVLEEEDDEYNILKQLLKEAIGGNDLERLLGEEIEDDKTFLWLAAQFNEYTWSWLDSYVDEKCSGGDSPDCPEGENIRAYCQALLESGFKKRDWEDFLSDANFFEDDYAEEVEDAGYEYDITDNPDNDFLGDFRTYCSTVGKKIDYQWASYYSGKSFTLFEPGQSNAVNAVQAYFSRDIYSPPFRITFSYSACHDQPVGGDGIALLFGKGPGNYQHFIPRITPASQGAPFLDRGLSLHFDMSGHIYLRDGDGELLESVTHEVNIGCGRWEKLKVDLSADRTLELKKGNEVLLTHTIDSERWEEIENQLIGWSAYTTNDEGQYKIRNISIRTY